MTRASDGCDQAGAGGAATAPPRARRTARAIGLAMLGAIVWVGGFGLDAARAQSQSGEPAPPPDAPAPSGKAPAVDLDQLLRLPDSYDAGAAQEKRGGVSAQEWRRRFDKALDELAEAERAIEKTQAELENAASESGNYQVNAPGVQNPEATPVNLGLRQQLKEDRALLEEKKRALRQLEIEADLAEVPTDWRSGIAATKRGSETPRSGLAPPESSP